MELVLFLSYPDRLWDCGALRLGIEGLEHDTGNYVSSHKVKSVCVCVCVEICLLPIYSRVTWTKEGLLFAVFTYLLHGAESFLRS